MSRATAARAWRPLLLAGLLGLAVSCGEETRRVNLILVSLDTCRADRLSPYGAERRTPALDALAAESALFEDCLAQSALTAPSHLSLLTSHYVHRHGLLNNQGSARPPYTLASALAALGWRTAAFTGHGSFRREQGLDFGFETFRSENAGEEGTTITRDLHEVLPDAWRWLDGVGAAPFFLLLHAYDPHCPFVPPEPFADEYGGWYEGELELDGICHPKAFLALMKDGTIGPEEIRFINDQYDAEVAAADATVATLLDELRRRGLLDNSIVVFTSDHGEVLGNHGWIGHGEVWEEALRVPLMIRFPGGEWAGRYDAPAQLIDVMPTLLSALGVPAPEGMQGVDLMPLVRGGGDVVEADRMRLARVGESPNRVAVRYGRRWKVILEEQDDKLNVLALHDLKSDPNEARNLADDEEERVARIVNRYAGWRRATAPEDRRFASEIGSSVLSDEDLELLEALGYAGEGDGAER